jgi:ABC-2 type transport system ATP-binding protein
MHQNNWAIETHELTRHFGDRRTGVVAVDHLDLCVPRGIIYGFLGPNGAGKSTTINMLVGLLRPTSGTAAVAGFSVLDQPVQVKQRIGVVPEGLSLYERLTAPEHIELVARLHGLDRGEIDRRIPPLLSLLELDDAANKMILDYSAGMRKKTAMAAALIHAPEVLFLDEPFESVDPISTRAIKQILRDTVDRRGTTVFFSTHVMELAERFCDQVGILNKGHLVASGSIPELRARAGLSESAPLEDVFLRTVQPHEQHEPELLEWLTTRDPGVE